MSDLAVLLVTLTALAAGWWLLARTRTLPDAARRDGAPVPPSVSVVVPARDEAATLPALLASLQRLAVPVPPEVVVVDDGSTDETAAVARAGDARVVSPGTPPDGWTGKAWACHVGAGSTSGHLLLFLDADTVLSPDALSGLLALHDRHGGLVTVLPEHRVVRPYEQLSAYFNAVSAMASSAFTRRPSSRAMAFGPCLLTSRADHDLVGGHAAVRAEILDDASLAAAYHRAGLPVVAAVGAAAVGMRSYPGGLRQLVDGWTKNIAAGASAASPRAALGTVLWVSVHHAVAVGAVLSLLQVATGWGALLTAGQPATWLVAYAGVAAQLRSVLRRVGTFRWWAWALFPLPLLAFDLVFARSAVLTVVRRSVRWRGRDVDLRGRSDADAVSSSTADEVA